MLGDTPPFRQTSLDLASGEVPSLQLGIRVAPQAPIERFTEGMVGPRTTICYAKGCDVLGESQDDFAEAVAAARAAELAIVIVGDKAGLTNSCSSGATRDRAELGLLGVQEQLVRAITETGMSGGWYGCARRNGSGSRTRPHTREPQRNWAIFDRSLPDHRAESGRGVVDGSFSQ